MTASTDRQLAGPGLPRPRHPKISPTKLSDATSPPTGPGLPVPVLPDKVCRSAPRLVVTTVDRDGRLADRTPVTDVGWSPGDTLELHTRAGPVIVARIGQGRAGTRTSITGRGHLRLPLQLRRHCDLVTGDRVAVAGHRQAGELIIMAASIVADFITAHRGEDP
ncbi:hypothetical protein [Actinoplanes sp. NPDC089786]|uniref:hypothetical protein n=1 Tax=Actinoplanes sp. NPDC089786 TaxID=3155185 RepID=UPI003449BD64